MVFLVEAERAVAILEGALEDSKEGTGRSSVRTQNFAGRSAERFRLLIFPLVQQKMLSPQEILFVDSVGHPASLTLNVVALTSDEWQAHLSEDKMASD